VASGDCQGGMGAYATVAAEYTRAAELAEVADDDGDGEGQRGVRTWGASASLDPTLRDLVGEIRASGRATGKGGEEGGEENGGEEGEGADDV
jgi:hypothetical protein